MTKRKTLGKKDGANRGQGNAFGNPPKRMAFLGTLPPSDRCLRDYQGRGTPSDTQGIQTAMMNMTGKAVPLEKVYSQDKGGKVSLLRTKTGRKPSSSEKKHHLT